MGEEPSPGAEPLGPGVGGGGCQPRGRLGGRQACRESFL